MTRLLTALVLLAAITLALYVAAAIAVVYGSAWAITKVRAR